MIVPRLSILCLLASLPGIPSLGQTAKSQNQTAATQEEGWQKIFFESPGQALPRLTRAAIRHSGQLKALSIDKSLGAEDVKLAKRDILNSFALGGGYTYGNQASIALNDPINPNQFTTFSSGRYQVGATFSLPLGQVASRGASIRKSLLSVERSEALEQEQTNQLRQQIITLYQNVLLARKLFTLQQEAYVNIQTNYQLAEKQFRQGQLALQELSIVSGQLTGVAVSRESSRSQYDTAFMLLEEVVGEKISTLMTIPYEFE